MTGSSLPIKLAILSCSYNRKKKTSAFLQSVISQKVPDNFNVDIYLLDDNSPDGTASHVEATFPSVHVVHGSGLLFWAGGMRTLWQHVLTKGDYDFFLLLNDDVVLYEGALNRLLLSHNLTQHPANIIMGTLQDSKTNEITYGGQRIDNKITGHTYVLQPDENDLLTCEIGNANIMLVDKGAVDKIGILSTDYTHGIADYDYTLRGIKNDVKAWVAPGYYGYCDNDHGVTWLPQSAPLKKRIAYLHSPKGLAYKENVTYVKKHFPMYLPLMHVKFWVKTLFPILYDLFKKEEQVKVQ